jgi:tetratricopeptide (TPR) repeat protein
LTYNNRGEAWREKGEYDKAIEDFSRAIRLNPNYAVAYNNRGNAWGDKGDQDKAIEDYNAFVRLDPKNPIGYLNRGDLWRRKRLQPSLRASVGCAAYL